MSEPTHYKQKQEKSGDTIAENKHRKEEEKQKRFFLSPKKNFAKREKKGWGRLTACIAGHAIQRKNPQDESPRFSKWRLPTLPRYSAVQYHRRCCLSLLPSPLCRASPLRCSPLSPARRRRAHRRPPRASDAFFSTQRPPLTHDYIKSMVSLIRCTIVRLFYWSLSL